VTDGRAVRGPTPTKDVAMKDRILAVLDEIRPTLQADGGDIEFIDFNEGVVLVRMRGACGSCPMSMVTLKQGVEARLKARIPEVLSVEQI
jgi:Fe-S cluster biogenesis protein NfuA